MESISVGREPGSAYRQVPNACGGSKGRNGGGLQVPFVWREGYCRVLLNIGLTFHFAEIN